MQDTINEQRKELHALRELLTDIYELAEGYADINNNGGPNLAMQIQMDIKAVMKGVDIRTETK